MLDISYSDLYFSLIYDICAPTCFVLFLYVPRMAWYFGMALVVNLVFGVWGSISIDFDTTQAIADPAQAKTCTLINDFILVFSML